MTINDLSLAVKITKEISDVKELINILENAG